MPRVAVVTDSTAYLPAATVAASGVTVVPLAVTLGDKTYAENVDLSPAEFVRWRSVSGRVATTSQPSPLAFTQAYDDAPGDAVVSVHLSGAMSGTVSTAQLAADECAREVRVVDSRLVGMGLGFAVLAAIDSAASGAGVDDVAAAARAAAADTRMLFYVNSLEHLHRGGRIGAAATLVGTALAVKPLFHLDDGVIAGLDKVRTAARAIARMHEAALAYAGDRPVDVAVHHLAAPERAEAMAEQVRAQFPSLVSLVVSEIGAVVGAHVGPGMLGLVVHARQ